MMKYAVLAGLAGALFVSTPALAQDESTAGGRFIAGAVIGIDSVNAEVGDLSDASEDLLPGVTIGYDFETRSGIVFGAEVEYTDSSVGVSTTDFLVEGDRFSINAGRDLYVGGRFGVRTGRNGLLYVKAGYTNGAIEFAYDDGAGPLSIERSYDGIRIGVGGEVDLGSNYALRVEYRYSDYGQIDFAGVNTGVEISRNQGIVTLLGKF